MELNYMKYDYMNFMVDEDKQNHNGVYLMSNGESLYIGKAFRENGLKQRYGSYVHNKANEDITCKGDELFQSDNSSAMYELYTTKEQFEDKGKSFEDYMIQMYNLIHPDNPLINKDLPKRLITVWDLEPYFNADHEINVPLLYQLGLMEKVK